MKIHPNILASIILPIVFLVLVFVSLMFLPLKNLKLGKITVNPAATITVIGEAKLQQRNQIASFTAGVTALSDKKEDAVNEVNSKIQTLIQSVKDFGIKEEDIQTQNISIYQREESYYEEGTSKSRVGQWNVSNSIQITLRDINKASELTNLLSASGANNVYGPNFSLENTKESEQELLGLALDDARRKAMTMAEKNNKAVGDVVSITEGSGNYSPYYGFGGGMEAKAVDAPTEVGSSTVYKSVTVIYEIN